MRGQTLHQVQIVRILDGYGVAFVEHRARRNRDCLLRPADDQDITLRAYHAAPPREVVGNGRTQRLEAL